MKKNFGFKLVYLLTLLAVLFNTFFSIKNSLFPKISDLPKGELQNSFASPSGSKTLDVFVVSNTLGSGIRAELKEDGKKAKTVFWQTGIDRVNVSWDNDYVVYIDNAPITADGHTVYDCRRGTSLFTDGALAEEFIR